MGNTKTVIGDVQGDLGDYTMSPLPELVDKASFVGRFKQAWAKGILHLHCGR